MRLFIIVLVGSLIWLMWFFFFGANTMGVDDANIFKIYARNFTQGHGFVYQVGGERVEGFSSFGYLMLLSLVYKIVGSLDLAGLSLGMVLFVMILFATLELADQLTKSTKEALGFSWFSGLVLAWLLASPFFVAWTGLSQMDLGLWTLVVLISLLWCVRLDAQSSRIPTLAAGSAIIVLSVITRPEGMLLALLLPATWFFKQRRLKNHVAGSVILTCSWIASVFAITWFRLQYFGWPLPNTYYAKVSPDLWYRLIQGGGYFWSFFSHNLIMIPMFIFMLFLFATLLKNIKEKSSINKQNILIVLLFTGLLILLPIFNGGDHFVGWRMYQPLWPVLGLLFVLYLDRFSPTWFLMLKTKINLVASMFGVFVLIVISQPHLFGSSESSLKVFDQELAIPKMSQLACELLNLWFASDETKPVVGVITAGKFALGYEGETYDLLGLNTVTIAHDGGVRKGIKNHASLNSGLVIQKKPDLLFPVALTYGQLQAASSISQLLWHNTLFSQVLFNDQTLKSMYQLVFITTKQATTTAIHSNTLGLAVYAQQNFLKKLHDTNEFQIEALLFQQE